VFRNIPNWRHQKSRHIGADEQEIAAGRHFMKLFFLVSTLYKMHNSNLKQIQQQVTNTPSASSANTTTVVTQQAPITSATSQPTQIQATPLATTTTLQGLANAIQGTQQLVFLNPAQLTTGLQPLLIQNQVNRHFPVSISIFASF
jgi:hypothetical protein